MTTIGSILLLILRIFSLILIARIIIEMIASFSREFRPPRWFAVIAEVLFRITDPALLWLRKLIPPLRMGNVALDMSVIVLFLFIEVLTMVVRAVFHV